jgi:hypothetical protein
VLTALLSLPQVSPTIVKIVPAAPTQEISVVDLIVGGLGLTGLIILCAVLVGGALGGLFIWFKHVRPMNPLNGQASQTHGLQLATTFTSQSTPQQEQR